MSRTKDHPDASTDDRRNSWMRLLVAFVAGAAATTAVLLLGGDSFAFDVGWVVLCAVYLLWVWLKVGRMDADELATPGYATLSPATSVGDCVS